MISKKVSLHVSCHIETITMRQQCACSQSWHDSDGDIMTHPFCPKSRNKTRGRLKFMYTANFLSMTWLYCRMAVNVTGNLSERTSTVTSTMSPHQPCTIQDSRCNVTVWETQWQCTLKSTLVSRSSFLCIDHCRTTPLYCYPPEGDDLENGWVGSHSITLLSDCTVTVHLILEWKKKQNRLSTWYAHSFHFQKQRGSWRTIVWQREKTLKFTFLASLDKGVSQEIFGRRIKRLSCVVICYHVNHVNSLV